MNESATLNVQRAKWPSNQRPAQPARRVKAEIPLTSVIAAISTISLQAVKPRNLGEFNN
jgi:hypothetical protein